jgi:hypothetical protein
MNPIYKFELNGQPCSPIYSQGLEKSFDLQAEEQFFRETLSGELTFVSGDYAMIQAMPIDFQFLLDLYISYDRGQSWTLYWQGTFWKTDCQFDMDGKKAIVKPTAKDAYLNVLAGIDREYNLIDLAPEIRAIKADKRPLTQIYVPGETTIGCFLSGMWWEQECEAITNTSDLTSVYHFGLKGNYRVLETSGDVYPPIPAVIVGDVPTTTNYTITQGNYRFEYSRSSAGSGRYREIYSVYVQDVLCWQADITTNNPGVIPNTVFLSPVASASGNLTLYMKDVAVYGRLIVDTPTNLGVPLPRIPEDDIVPDNRNYHYCSPFTQFDVAFSAELWPTPTQWGMYQPGQYYQVPDQQHDYFPIGRSMWDASSLWIVSALHPAESQWRQPFVIRDAYPLASVISVLLGQIAPEITHEGNASYSDFLYGQNAIREVGQTLLLTPKSNIIYSGYDQPAQKAPITLRNVLDMLRDCFRCYWWIDEFNRFRIEHIQYFRNGGSYNTAPAVAIDLTSEKVLRNGKPWAWGMNKYSYEKPEMTARYQFGWMDDVTQQFEGWPIDIRSKYVNAEKIEQITVNLMTSDIDYVLLNPNEVSKDGFVLLSAVASQGSDYQYELPYLTFQQGLAQSVLQNGYAAFVFLQRYYSYDLPARNYEINGEQGIALGVKKLKIQDVSFPAIYDPDLFNLIRTFLGDGQIQKLSINLSSRQATVTLRYDTE